jgi:hypothetical protein
VLLLVLILVSTAFGVWAVALLSGSVLWAWVSVGISLSAGVVLLIDLLQRRAAVRAGSETASPEAGPPGPTGPPARAPAADQLRGGPAPYVEPATEVLPIVPPRASPPHGSAEGASGADDVRFDQRSDAQQTVALPVVQPSSSTDRPSGATGGTPPASGSSSPSVTRSGGESPGPDRDPASDPQRQRGSAAGPTGEEHDAAEPGRGSDPQATVVVSVPGRQPAGAVQDRGAGQPDPAADDPDGGPTGSAPPPSGPEGEPPEEPRDADAAALVAELDDEVVVVDEQPRYHMAGCRSLPGRPTIPLPAREAVELGFTPCGWCTPDRVLSSRHPAGTR